MGQAFSAIPEEMIRFVGRQALFFVATAPADGHVNLSPKGMDSFVSSVRTRSLTPA